MNTCISLGKFNKNHIYIILSIICLIFNDIISGYNYNDTFIAIFDNNTHEKFGEHNLINHIFCYIGTFLLSTILYIKEMNFLRKNKKPNNKMKKEKDKQLDNKKDLKISYIHNSFNSVKDIAFSKKTLFCFISLMFIWIIEEHLFELYSILKDLDFWMVEIIIVSLIMSKMFHFNIFRHHILTFAFNCIPIILKILTIILSFKDESNQDFNCGNNIINYQYDYSCEYYYNNINRFNNNTYNNTFNNANEDSIRLKKLYVIFTWLVPVGIITYLFLIILRSYINSKLKWFMDLKYISANKLLLIYGFLGAVICSIICIFTTFKECEITSSNNKNIYDYICILNIDDENNIKRKYFDNYYIYYQHLDQKEIYRLLFQVLFYFFHKHYSILIIKFFTPVHLILSFPISYFFEKIIMIIHTLFKSGSIFSDTNFNFKLEKFCLDFMGDIISIFGFLIYLEIIELNFCKFNYNLRRNITNRGINELTDDSDDRNSTYYQDESVELGTMISTDSIDSNES